MAHYYHDRGVKGRARRQAASHAKKIGIIILVVIIIFIVIGIIYTWLVGRQSSTILNDKPAGSGPQIRKPFAPDPDAAVGVAVQLMNSPLRPGENAMVSIRTLPGAVCTIKVEYNKLPVVDSGVIEKLADDYGVATWSWTVSADAPPGNWPVDITCKRNARSGYLHLDFEVKKSTP
ncbi:MAG: hypothetical protein WBB39_00220 [Candidatus Saccharimonadales bacterium]